MAATDKELFKIVTLLHQAELDPDKKDKLEFLSINLGKGCFHDFKSPVALPKVELYNILTNLGQASLAARVKSGEFDERYDNT